jgi:hypothetical protein
VVTDFVKQDEYDSVLSNQWMEAESTVQPYQPNIVMHDSLSINCSTPLIKFEFNVWKRLIKVQEDGFEQILSLFEAFALHWRTTRK